MTKSQLSPPPPSMNQNKKKLWKCDQHLIKMNFGAKKFLKKNFFWKNSKSNIPPPPWFSPKKCLKGCDTYWKWTNGAFSGVKTFIFEFNTMETTKKTYISIIRQVWKTAPKRGVFSPKCPRGAWTRILPRSVTVVLYLVQLPPHFDRVSEKNNGWIKCYEAKSVILATLGHFGAF